MGFLKFLKREPKKDMEELDLPPEPPPIEGFDEAPELPDFDLDERISAPEQPKMGIDLGDSGLGDMEMPEFPLEEQEPMPSPEPQAEIESAPSVDSKQLPEPSIPNDDFPRMERRLFSHEKMPLNERPGGKTIYVRIDKFKATLGSISMIRSDLRKTEDALMKLEGLKNSKDKSFDKVRASLDDLQKKLIFVDKTLFKEG